MYAWKRSLLGKYLNPTEMNEFRILHKRSLMVYSITTGMQQNQDGWRPVLFGNPGHSPGDFF
jgi:hypothetical protein